MDTMLKSRPLLLSQIRRSLGILNKNTAELSVDLGEVFYEFWRGEGLMRQFLDASGKDEAMRVLVELQILFEHVGGHISGATIAMNGITEMNRVAKLGRGQKSST